MRAAASALVLLGLAAAWPAAAQTAAPGAFDFYVLSLSWSPGFCATGGDQKAKDQCAAGSGLGFVVHGLWPQYDHGFPGDCGPAGRSPSRQALDTVRGVYPDEGLARYEWRKHGTCSGLSPTDYFSAVRRARDAVVVPTAFQSPRAEQTWAPIDVARAFSAANPGLRTDEMAVTCRSGDLQEVRVCFAKDLRGFVPCPEVARASCHASGISVPPVR
jgi:ribonuclease T2